jgi:Ca-activated chloride channel family protein
MTRTHYPWSIWCGWVLALPMGLLILGAALVTLTEVGNIPFDNLGALWLLAVVPASSALILYGVHRRRRALDRFSSPTLAPLLALRISPVRQAIRAALLVIAVSWLVTAILGPRWGMYLQKQKVRGIDLVVAVDVSRSMLAPDLLPNRLEFAKNVIAQQLLERPLFSDAHRLGLMAFAGSTSLKVPLTTDRLSFRSKLEALRVGSAPRGGTALGKAIVAACDLFVKSPEQATKVILLFTDGEDHEGGPVDEAERARRERGILVYTVGVGNPSFTSGVQVPGDDAKSSKPLLYDGQIVFSKLDVEGLRRIAEAGGGRFSPVGDFHAQASHLANLRGTELSAEERMRHVPRYQWFVAAALICLGLETTIREGRATQKGSAMRRVWQIQAQMN